MYVFTFTQSRIEHIYLVGRGIDGIIYHEDGHILCTV